MRIIYDMIDPEIYETRHERCPREAYLYHHWRPVISKLIQLICKILRKYYIKVEALDVGCGTGVYTEEISRYTQKCVGLDLSENMLEYARKKRKELNLVLADAHKLPFRDKSFNLVVTVGLLEYVQKDSVLKEIAMVMRKGAFLIVVIPNKYSMYRLPIKILTKISGRKYVPKEPSLKEMLRSSHQLGFKLIWYKIDDGLIFIPDFLDKVIGKYLYIMIERISKLIFRRNPFSNVMLLLLYKR